MVLILNNLLILPATMEALSFLSTENGYAGVRQDRKGEELADYVDLLKNGLIRPSKLEIYVMNLKELKPIQLTDNGAANFGPYFHPER